MSDGNNITNLKHDCEVFLKFADMSGIPYAEDADAGIEASKRAGMKTVSVHGVKGADVEIVDRLFI